MVTQPCRCAAENSLQPHIWGQPASANPLLQLSNSDGGKWFQRYSDSFKAVWPSERPWAPDSPNRFSIADVIAASVSFRATR
ncbi:hypothetical protein GCM10010339_60520 [Streptomyces alanosinicus]|uniref:Uncharacterized protein n=1 Tax=Streptomyces alanosinicus TaxID=68171 RepID=A0A918YM43_9ACTN|nr:hypothetical protein GCM10010339_60520 [Streptomyces alanosinicus]